MTLVDSHCHLDMLEDVPAALVSARDAGVGAVVTIGIDLATSRGAIELAAAHDEVFATVAVHPQEAATLDHAVLEGLEELAARPKVVAVGECGLDYYYEKAPRDVQRQAFVAQIELARRAGLPLVVHVRDAGREAMELLGEHAAGLTVVMHCFALPEYVEECNERGYYASFAGNVTFKNAGDLRAAAARVREDRLMVETDAPYLTPVPYRGKPNEPARVVHTAGVVAEVRGWSEERAAEVTTANACRAFGLPAASAS